MSDMGNMVLMFKAPINRCGGSAGDIRPLADPLRCITFRVDAFSTISTRADRCWTQMAIRPSCNFAIEEGDSIFWNMDESLVRRENVCRKRPFRVSV